MRSSSTGQLVLGRRAAELVLELGVGLLEGSGLGPHRPGHPVDRAQLVEDGALDAGDGVGLELVAPLGIELLDGVDEPEHAVADQVGLLDVLGQADGDPAGHVLHQRRVDAGSADHGRRARLESLYSAHRASVCAASSSTLSCCPVVPAQSASLHALGWVASSTRTEPLLADVSVVLRRRQGRHGRASPARRGGRHPRRAGGWRRCGAGRGGGSATALGGRGGGARRVGRAGCRAG